MYLDPYELKSFTILARELHFRRAAEQLCMSQPALSKQIRRLEEKVGVELFARTRRKVTLTEPGRVLVPLADKLLKESESALTIVKEASSGRAGILRIGFGLAAVSDILPRTILRFNQNYPLIKLQMCDMSTPLQLTALLQQSLDLGILRLPIASAELDSLPLIRERLVLAVPKSFRYSHRDRLSTLRDAPFVLISRSASATFHNHALSVCRSAGFTPNVVQESGETFTILNFVRAGLGVSLVQSAAARMKVPGVRFHELQMSESEWSIGTAWMRNSEKRDLIQKFVDTIRTVVRVPPVVAKKQKPRMRIYDQS
jgi:DNA-binding transcriptional LysR family regulator